STCPRRTCPNATRLTRPKAPTAPSSPSGGRLSGRQPVALGGASFTAGAVSDTCASAPSGTFVTLCTEQIRIHSPLRGAAVGVALPWVVTTGSAPPSAGAGHKRLGAFPSPGERRGRAEGDSRRSAPGSPGPSYGAPL